MMNCINNNKSCDNASGQQLPFSLDGRSSDMFHVYLEALQSVNSQKNRVRLPDRALFDNILPYFNCLLKDNKVYLAKIFYGSCFDFKYNAVLPTCLVCDQDPDTIVIPSNISVYCNRMFLVKLGSEWCNFLGCLDDFEQTILKNIELLPSHILSRLRLPKANVGFGNISLVNVSCDPGLISDAVASGIKDALASDPMSKVIMSSKVVGIILQLIPTIMSPSVSSIVSFVYNIFVNCFVVSDVIIGALSFLQPYFVKIIEFFEVVPVANALNIENYVPLIESISAVILTIVSIIGVAIVPSSKSLIDCIKIAGVVGRGLNGFKNLFEYLYLFIKEMFEWAYYSIFKIPFSSNVVDGFEKEIIDLFTEINEIEKQSNLDKIRTDESIRVRIRNANFHSHHIQKVLLQTKVDLQGLRYFSDLVKRIEKLSEKAEIYACSDSGPRPEPVVIQIFGDSGLGKSHVPFFLATDIVAHMGIDSDVMKYVYSRNIEQEFWDGYNRNHHVVIYDDFGQIRDTVTSPNVEFMELIRSGNISPWPLHMAAINEKASTYFRSSAIILTSNEVDYNIQSLTHKEAYYRRVDLRYKISVDPKYTNIFGAIDESKVVKYLGVKTSEEIYRFTPYFRTGTSNNPTFVPMMDSNNVAILLTYDEMKDQLIDKFNEKQSHSLSRITAIEKRFAKIIQDSYTNALDDSVPIAQVALSAAEQFLIAFWGTGGNVDKFYKCDEKIINKLRNIALSCDQWYDFLDYIRDSGIELLFVPVCSVSIISEFVDGVLYNNKPYIVDQSNNVVKSIKEYIVDFAKSPIYQSIATILGTIGVVYSLYKLYGWFFGGSNVEVTPIPNLIIEGNPSGDNITMHKPSVKTENVIIEGNMSGDQVTNYLNSIKTEHINVEGNPSGDQITKHLNYVKTENGIVSNDISGIPNIPPQVEAYIDVNSQEIVTNCLTPNVYRIGSGNSSFVANILFVKGQVALCNWHVYDFLKQYDIINIRNPYLNTGYSFEYSKIKAINIRNSNGVNKDAVLLVFPRTILTHRNIINHFVSSTDISKFSKISGILFGVVSDNKGRMISRVEPLSCVSSIDTLNYRYNTTILNMRDGYSYNSQSGSGDCGSVLMINDKMIPRKICGIHSAGEKGIGYAISVSIEDLNRSLEEVPFENKISIELHSNVDVTARSQCKFNGDFVYIGKSDVNGSCPTKTDIFPSLLYNKVSQVKCAPSVLRPIEIDGEIIDPLIKGIEKCQENYVDIDDAKLQMAYDDYLPKLLHNAKVEHQRVLTYEEAIMGTDDVFMCPMNRRSSPGFGWTDKNDGKVGKTKWLGDDSYILDNEELKQAVLLRETKALQGVRAPHLWVDTLKVERRPIEKVQLGKTRVFSVGQMDYILLCRKYYLGFCAHVMHNRIDNEMAVGINPYSIEWTKLAKHQLKFGHKCVAGDYKNFDGNALKKVLEKIFDYYVAFMNLNREGIGMPWEDFIKIARVLFDEMVSSIHLCRDIVYMWTHSNPSGNPITTILNCLYGILLMRLAYISIFSSVEGFKCNVALVTYGDDNHLGISDEIIDFFNQHSITKVMPLFGMEYTDEVKSNIATKWREIDNTTFLKRGFVLRNCRYDAPLNLDTCLEMINWVRGTLDTDLLLLTNVETSCNEFSLHDKNVFLYWIELIRKRCYEVGLFPTIHTYENYRYMQYISQMGGVGKFIDDESI